MREKRLNKLRDDFYIFAVELIAKCAEAGISICIVETFRSAEAHQEDLKNNRSWIKRSKHQDGIAIDIAPYEIFSLHGEDKINWNSKDPVWLKMGEIGESLGLVWGGRWEQKDMGHFELPYSMV